MYRLIKKWLTKRLGVDVDYKSSLFAEQARDGKLISDMLYTYDIITKEQKDIIVSTFNKDEAYQNFSQHIIGWLKSIGITCSELDIDEIISARGSAALNLLYKIFLELENKSELHLESLAIPNKKSEEVRSKFTVTPAAQEDETFELPSNPLFDFVTDGWDVLCWYREKFKHLNKTLIASREAYQKFKCGSEQDIDAVPKRVSFKSENYARLIPQDKDEDEESDIVDTTSYSQLVNEQEDAQHMEVSCTADLDKAKRIVKEVKMKHKKDLENRIQKELMQKELLHELWNDIQRKQEDEFVRYTEDKLLKQSMYEKQMVGKMLEARHQRNIVYENRLDTDNKIQKEREAELEQQLFLQEKQRLDQSTNYYSELDRLNELHKRLYKEELRLKKKKRVQLCRETVDALVDYAVAWSEYTQLYGTDGVNGAERHWKWLFFEGKSILATVKPVEDIVQYDPDMPDNIELLFRTEIERQDTIDEKSFEEYFNLIPPHWSIGLIENSEELMPLIDVGMNVLGYIVHRVLLSKYPYPVPAPKPELNIEIAAAVDGIYDLTILPVLRQLLVKRNVRIIETQDAINFCLEAYKKEIKPDDFEEIPMNQDVDLEDFIPKAKKKPKGDKKPKKNKKKDLKTKKGFKKSLMAAKVDLSTVATESTKQDKKVQTPKWLPGDDIFLSPTADLGKTAYEELNLGNQLTPYLVSAMLTEYLKQLKDMNRFVLINYPTNCEETAFLEEMLTGTKVPGIAPDLKYLKSIVDLMELDYRDEEETEDIESRRKSRLLQNPVVTEEPEEYKTFCTAFIKIKQTPPEEIEGGLGLPPILTQKEDEMDWISKFYSDQGCLYYMYYKILDFASIKYLAKLIIGDFTLPLISSVELFGEDIKYVEADFEAYKQQKQPTSEKKGEKEKGKKKKVIVVKAVGEDEGKKGKGGKKEKRGKTDKGSKKSKDTSSKKGSKKDKKGKKGAKAEKEEPKTFDDKEVQVPEAEEEEVEEVIMEEVKPNPGEPGWIYVNLPIPEPLQVALATLWEAIEEVYITDFKEAIFLRRTHVMSFNPFKKYVKDIIDHSLNSPDNKQKHVTDFQILYNSIDEDLREDEEMKAELHCRIAEFKEKLIEIADANMMNCESSREKIIMDNWVPIQVCDIMNCYVCGIQIELDRCTQTFQLLNDYYSATVTGRFLDEFKLQNTVLPRINSEDEQTITTIATNINKFFSEFDEVDANAFRDYLDAVFKRAEDTVEENRTICYKVIKKMEERVFSKKPFAKKKKDKKKGKSSETSGESDKTITDGLREDMPRLVSEWKTAVEGEKARVKLRLGILQNHFLLSTSKQISLVQSMFLEVYNKIKNKYDKEVHSIETICEVLARATEKEVPIEPELILDLDMFKVNHRELLYEKLPELFPDPFRPAEGAGDTFTIEQLSLLVDILIDLAPNGLIPERSFVYLLQDLLVNNTEDGALNLMPKVWRKMKPNDLNKLSDRMFFSCEYVQWKDFIIWNLPVYFPSENELMMFRKAALAYDPDLTELIKDYQFNDIEFWFDITDLDKLQIRELLFKMYAINEDTLNYTALLLDFCKDLDPCLGLVKALELSLGKYLCYDKEQGDEYISALYAQKEVFREHARQMRIEKRKNDVLIMEILKDLIDKTVHECDSVLITEYQSDCQIPGEATSQFWKIDPIESLHVGFTAEDQTDDGRKFSQEIEENIVELQEGVRSADIMHEANLPEERFELLYTLELEPIICVMTAALPWHSRVQSVQDQSIREIIEEIYEECKNPDFNNIVFSHVFISHKRIHKLMSETNKFMALQLYQMVCRVLGQMHSGSD